MELLAYVYTLHPPLLYAPDIENLTENRKEIIDKTIVPIYCAPASLNHCLDHRNSIFVKVRKVSSRKFSIFNYYSLHFTLTDLLGGETLLVMHSCR